MAEAPQDPWAVTPSTDDQATVSPDHALTALEAVGGVLLTGVGEVASGLLGAGDTWLTVVDPIDEVHAGEGVVPRKRKQIQQGLETELDQR